MVIIVSFCAKMREREEAAAGLASPRGEREENSLLLRSSANCFSSFLSTWKPAGGLVGRGWMWEGRGQGTGIS